MKSLASTLQFAVALLAAATFFLSPPARLETPQIAAATTATPLCTCQSCDCEVCSCTPIADHEPLTDQLAGNPPDVYHVASAANPQQTGQLVQIAPDSIQRAPATPIVPVALKAPKTQPAATGHWETRYAGFRGRRSYQVWVPHAIGACSASSCSTQSRTAAGCSSGSCQPQQYYSSGGGCASCGRGRR